jgi:hypothetical protein
MRKVMRRGMAGSPSVPWLGDAVGVTSTCETAVTSATWSA